MNTCEKKVIQWIDDNKDYVVAFLRDLIRIPSVNACFDDGEEWKKEGDAQRFVAKHMESLGAEIDLWEPDAERLGEKYEGHPGYFRHHKFENRPNLAATLKGTGGGKSILLMGHIDVVSPGSGWDHDPFAADIVDGRMYGRGTVDMKGGIAAMVMALDAIEKSGYKLKGDACIGTIVDEESGGMGTLAFCDRGYRADAGIMTEGTENKIAPMCRGILWGTITIPGRSGHIELPSKDWREGGSVDAIKKARIFLDAFDRLNEDWAKRKTHPLLSTPCQLYVATVKAGEYCSTFANSAVMDFDIQFLPSERDSLGGGTLVMKEVEEFVAAIAQTDPWLKENPPTIHWVTNADCGEVAVDHPFVQMCAESFKDLGYPVEMEGCYFHTDTGWPERTGTPMINLGPGDPRVAHQDNENLHLDDYIECIKKIAAIVMKWCEIAE